MKDYELDTIFRELNRAFFIDNENKEYAHYDKPLSIGYEQTISQPSLVYMMTLKLDIDKMSKVLEIGTGSGYQTAILAELSDRVFTVERIKDLSDKAKERLKILNYNNIKFKVGNGSEGWEEYAPYDRIMVTAAADEIPDSLIEQLKPKGKMIIPVGPRERQELLMVYKNERGKIKKECLCTVRFVELVNKS